MFLVSCVVSPVVSDHLDIYNVRRAGHSKYVRTLLSLAPALPNRKSQPDTLDMLEQYFSKHVLPMIEMSNTEEPNRLRLDVDIKILGIELCSIQNQYGCISTVRLMHFYR
jgi:hypothetical protein